MPLQSAELGTRLIKYGVVSTKTICADLYDWKTLYLSGRMHKPVHFLSSNEQIRTAGSANLAHALHFALLCLPEKFSESELFMVLCPERVQYIPALLWLSVLTYGLIMMFCCVENRGHLVLGRLSHDVWREPQEGSQHRRRQL